MGVRPFFALLILGSSALTACLFDHAVPEGAQLSCLVQEDCPPGYTCREAIGMCVESSQIDADAPRLDGEPLLVPELGSIGDSFVLSFSVSETLYSDPVVTLDVGGGREAPFELDQAASDSDALDYVYSYTADGSEAQGAREISIAVADVGGNAAELPGGLLTLDFVAPRITGASVNPEVIGAGATATLDLTLSEPAEGIPEVTMASDAGATLTWTHVTSSPDGLQHELSYTAGGTEAEAVYIVSAAATDAAGNSSAAEQAGKLTLDFTAPSVVDQIVSPGDLVRPGSIVTVSLELNEELPAAPTLTAIPAAASGTPLSFGVGTFEGTALSFTHTVRTGSDGDYQLELGDLIDAAGNLTAAQSLGDLTVDGEAPTIVNFWQSAETVNGTDSLTVTFEATEMLASPPLVDIEGLAFTQDVSSGDAPYRYSLDLAGSDLFGSFFINVTVVDLAENAATQRPGVVTIDARPPNVIDVVFTPPAAQLGSTVLLTVTVDEPLLEPVAGQPVIDLYWQLPEGDPGFQFLVRSGLAYTFSLVVDGTLAEEAYTLTSVGLTDEADNAALVDLAAVLPTLPRLRIDNLPPVISGLATDHQVYSAQTGFDLITLTFDVDEDLDDAPASIEARIDNVDFYCQGYQLASPSYTCTRPVDDAVDSHGGALIRLTTTDTAGNQAFASTSVEFDFQAPSVAPGSETVQLLPAPGTPLTQVSKVTLGTTVRIFFSADETLDATPQVFSPGTPQLDFNRTGGAGTFFIFEHLFVNGAAADGPRTVEVSMSDLVGNSATRALALPAPGFEIDTSPPAPMSGAQVDRLRYVRMPWGTGASAGEPSYHVEQSLAGGFAAGTTVVFWDRAAASSALEIGRAVVDAGGTLPQVTLNRSDRDWIYASLVDEAGNIDGDTATRIANVDWVATLNGKVQGSLVENPHRAETRSWLGSVVQPAEESSGAAEADPLPLQVTDGDTVRVEAASIRWRKMPAADPPANEGNKMVFDAARGVAVLFINGSGETWEHRDGVWEQIAVRDLEGDGSPAASGEYQIGYDHRLSRVTLIDTRTAALPAWQWDGESWRLVQPSDPEGDGNPPRRQWACSAWDGVNGKLVVYGGEISLSSRWQDWVATDDLWGFDGESWERLDPVPASPRAPAVFRCAMTWNPAQRRVILLRNETWEWDGVGWEQITAGAWATPQIARDHRMVYDTVRQRAVAHGGANEIDSVVYETWDYNGATKSWSLAHPEDWTCPPTEPCWRIGHGMVFDQGAGRTLLFAGKSHNFQLYNDTWTFDGSSWERQPLGDPEGDGDPVPGPYVPFGYDQDRKRALLCNSGGAFGDPAEFWSHDGDSWELLTVEDNLGDSDPRSRWGGALAYDDDPSRQHFVFFGGYGECPGIDICADTWTFDGVEWEERCDWGPAGDLCDAGDGLPAGRWFPAAAFDSSRKETYLYGSSADAEGQRLWKWDGTLWHLEVPGSMTLPPTALEAPTMAYDEDRDVLVMFGGWEGASRTLPHVWEWSIVDSEWSEHVPTDPENDGSPETGWQQASYFDRARGVVVLHEHRFDLPPPVLDSWEWDGQSWRRLHTASPVTGEGPVVTHPQGSLLSVHSSTDGRTFMIGDQLWEMERATAVRPAVTLHFDFGAAHAPAGSTILEVFVDASAGASGEVAASPTDSVALSTWSSLGWDQQLTAAHPPDTPGALTWSTGDPAAIGDLQADGTMNFAIGPEGLSGDTGAVVEVDYAEVRVRYQLP